MTSPDHQPGDVLSARQEADGDQAAIPIKKPPLAVDLLTEHQILEIALCRYPWLRGQLWRIDPPNSNPPARKLDRVAVDHADNDPVQFDGGGWR